MYFFDKVRNLDPMKRIQRIYIRANYSKYSWVKIAGNFRLAAEFKSEIEQAWNLEVVSRKGTVLNWTKEFISAKHIAHAAGKHTVGCIGCKIAYQIEKTGQAPFRMIAEVERDVRPEQLVSQSVVPKTHKKKRWMTEGYHKRIQRRWNNRALGKSELVSVREVVEVSVSRAMFYLITGNRYE